jgi:hypothetical protein
MQDISGFGARVQIRADKTFPSGFVLTQFADDVDPFDVPSTQIADKAMGMNGDLISWAKATPTEITVAVMPLALRRSHVEAELRQRLGRAVRDLHLLAAELLADPLDQGLVLVPRQPAGLGERHPEVPSQDVVEAATVSASG